jgi:hypothetical protein
VIHLVDDMLLTLLKQGVPILATGNPATVDSEQIGFQPPDQDWRTHVANLKKNAVNVYLIEMHENRKYRSLERSRWLENGQPVEERAPAKLDCHYLVSVQTPTVPTSLLDPTPDEHRILYQVARALMRADPLNASRIYSGAALTAVPPRLRSVDFPLTVAPPEGFFKIAEFWGTMGQNYRWKPILHLIVGLPVEFLPDYPGPMVTTRILEYRRISDGTLLEETIAIGGTVYDAQNPANAAGVSLLTAAGQVLQQVTTDSTGRFLFDGLERASYQLLARSSDGRTVTNSSAVPSPLGTYDLLLP